MTRTEIEALKAELEMARAGWHDTLEVIIEDRDRALESLQARDAEVAKLREALRAAKKELDDGGMWSLADDDEEGNSVTRAMDILGAALSAPAKEGA